MNTIGCPNPSITMSSERKFLSSPVKDFLAEMVEICERVKDNEKPNEQQVLDCCGHSNGCRPSSCLANTPSEIGRLFSYTEFELNAKYQDYVSNIDLVAHGWSKEQTWNFFGSQVYVVHVPNTPQSNARLNNAKNELGALGLWDSAVVWNAKMMENGHEGCWLAHKEIAADAVKKGYKSIMIFEDDIELKKEFRENSLAMIAPAAKYLADNKYDWEVFYFTHNPQSIQLLPHSTWDSTGVPQKIVGVRSWATVGYSIRGEGLHRLATSTFADLYGHTVDGILHQSKAFAIYPSLATHPPNKSQITGEIRKLQWDKNSDDLFEAAKVCKGAAHFEQFDYERPYCENSWLVI